MKCPLVSIVAIIFLREQTHGRLNKKKDGRINLIHFPPCNHVLVADSFNIYIYCLFIHLNRVSERKGMEESKSPYVEL